MCVLRWREFKLGRKVIQVPEFGKLVESIGGAAISFCETVDQFLVQENVERIPVGSGTGVGPASCLCTTCMRMHSLNIPRRLLKTQLALAVFHAQAV